MSSLVSLFGPAIPADPDTAAVTLGLKFTPKTAGTVAGIMFWVSPANRGPHVGTLWGPDGKRLASVTFPATAGTGWHEAMFDRPIEVVAGREYTVSYRAPHGRYAATNNAFTRPVTTEHLAAPIAAGVYTYGDGRPTQTWKDSSYFVDVLFAVGATIPDPGPSTPATPTSPTEPSPQTEWPDASTTGVPAGTTLETIRGDLTITTPGAVVEGIDINGSVYIRAANVTLRNSIVRGRVDTGDANRHPGALIQRVEIIGPYDSAADGGFPAVGYTGFTCDRCHIRGWGKGFGLVRDATITDSWVHDIVYHGDPARGGSHNEAVLSLGGANFVMTGNRFDASRAPNMSASVALYSQMELIRDVVMERNLLNGGGYNLYAGSNDAVHARNVKIRDNVFGPSVYGPVTSWRAGNGNEWSGNILEATGQLIRP